MKKKLTIVVMAVAASACALMVDTVKTTSEFSYALNGLKQFHDEAKTHVESVSDTMSPEVYAEVSQALIHLDGLKGQLLELEASGDWQSLLDNPQAVRLEYLKAARSFQTIRAAVMQSSGELNADQLDVLATYETNAHALYNSAGALLDKGEAAESLRKVIKIAQLAAKTAKYL